VLKIWLVRGGAGEFPQCSCRNILMYNTVYLV